MARWDIGRSPFDSPVNVPGGIDVVEPTVRWSRRWPLRSFRASSLGFCVRMMFRCYEQTRPSSKQCLMGGCFPFAFLFGVQRFCASHLMKPSRVVVVDKVLQAAERSNPNPSRRDSLAWLRASLRRLRPSGAERVSVGAHGVGPRRDAVGSRR